MKLQLLLQREDFITIFKNTFSHYLTNNFDWEGEISWISLSRISTHNYFLVNKRLNLIYPTYLDRAFLDPFKMEYVYHKNPIRHTLQKFYAKMATSSPLESILSTSVIEIDPWLEELGNWCILPGNHTIRLINFRTNSSEVIHKAGFNRIFIENEIKIRSEFAHPSIPKLIDYDIENGRYKEEKIQGLPLNRYSDQKQKFLAFRSSLDCLRKLHNETRQSIDLQEWLYVLVKKLLTIEFDLRNEETDKLWSEIFKISKQLSSIVEKKGSSYITTTITHGDFQSANILHYSKNKKTYLIDWEYCGRRFYLYDYYVYFYNSRFPRGLANRIKQKNAKCDIEYDFDQGIYDLLKLNSTSWVFALLLLEDLIVRLGELYVPAPSVNNKGLGIFLDEVNNWVSDKI